jgi:protein-disulfide isomerase
MTESTNYMTPLSIVAAGALIATALFFGGKGGGVATGVGSFKQAEVGQGLPVDIETMRPISSEDHILGNLDAPVKIVEYSDYECPFCKRIHPTLAQIMDEYGKDGRVAWVYRHFPLDELHPLNAKRVAVASECASEQGGNSAFWQFTDAFFEMTPANDRTDLDTVIPQILGGMDIDRSAFDVCFASDKYDKHIQDDIDDAIATGGRGTPWSIVVAQNGKAFPINGAQPYSAIKQLVDLALLEK